MSLAPVLVTDRLILRGWQDDDLPAFAAMNADPRGMEFFPNTLSREESDARAALIVEPFARHGFGLRAVEAPGTAKFVGFVGLSVPDFEAHFTPCVEIGWRLAYEHWKRGYAIEAARRALAFGFELTVPSNERSQRVMLRLGMRRSPGGDFEHPKLPEAHPFAYRLRIFAMAREPAAA